MSQLIIELFDATSLPGAIISARVLGAERCLAKHCGVGHRTTFYKVAKGEIQIFVIELSTAVSVAKLSMAFSIARTFLVVPSGTSGMNERERCVWRVICDYL